MSSLRSSKADKSYLRIVFRYGRRYFTWFLPSNIRLVHNQVLFSYLIDLPCKASSNRIFNIPCNLRHRYLLNWLFIRPYK